MNYVFLADGFEEVEALATVDVLRRAGLPVTTVSIYDRCEVRSSHGVAVLADKVFETVDFSDAVALVLPGGMPGSVNLAAHAGLCRLVKEHAGANKLVAAICAAPLVFGRLGLLEGRRATIYPGMESELAGAVCTDVLVVRDGNIITGQGPAAAFAFGYKLVETLLDAETAEGISQGMLYNKIAE